jgi:hypothetical protein
VSYRPREIPSANEAPTGRKVDGSATRHGRYSISGNLTAGSTTRSSTMASGAITSAVAIWGGCLRSNSTFQPASSYGIRTLTSNWGWVVTFDLNGGLYRIRQTPGSNYSGAGNVLSDPDIVMEWIP